MGRERSVTRVDIIGERQPTALGIGAAPGDDGIEAVALEEPRVNDAPGVAVRGAPAGPALPSQPLAHPTAPRPSFALLPPPGIGARSAPGMASAHARHPAPTGTVGVPWAL
jgi:hypothetical protein